MFLNILSRKCIALIIFFLCRLKSESADRFQNIFPNQNIGYILVSASNIIT